MFVLLCVCVCICSIAADRRVIFIENKNKQKKKGKFPHTKHSSIHMLNLDFDCPSTCTVSSEIVLNTQSMIRWYVDSMMKSNEWKTEEKNRKKWNEFFKRKQKYYFRIRQLNNFLNARIWNSAYFTHYKNVFAFWSLIFGNHRISSLKVETKSC